MIKPNTRKNKVSIKPSGGIASNTRPIPPNTTLTTTNKSSKVTDSRGVQENRLSDNSLAVFHNHLDWLTLNFTQLTKSDFEALIKLTGRGLVVYEENKQFSQGEKAKNYQNTISSPIGFKGAYNSYKSKDGIDNHYDVTISLSGEYFRPLTTIEQWELCRDLFTSYSATCSRVDTSVDDYSFKNIPLSQMIEAYRRDDKFDFSEYYHNTKERDPNNPTTVHYFGAEGSKKLVRVYKHKNKCLRLETQFRSKYAREVFEIIATLERVDETDDEWSRIILRTIGGIGVGTIDFRDKSKLKNPAKACKSKTKRLPFWEDFIDKIGAVHLIKIPSTHLDMTTYQATFNWFEKIASRTLAKVFHMLGEDRFLSYIYRLVKLGESKLTPGDKKEIEYLRSNLEYLDLD